MQTILGSSQGGPNESRLRLWGECKAQVAHTPHRPANSSVLAWVLFSGFVFHISAANFVCGLLFLAATYTYVRMCVCVCSFHELMEKGKSTSEFQQQRELHQQLVKWLAICGAEANKNKNELMLLTHTLAHTHMRNTNLVYFRNNCLDEAPAAIEARKVHKTRIFNSPAALDQNLYCTSYSQRARWAGREGRNEKKHMLIWD